ncbi:unnamed protein product [Peronospora effusa]|uniref:Uncharacterized protein n=1 Tax=Peronospora effusa TaxID=542832 RepID=A0A3M6VVZ8_9STRA|nr:hypothetical protein DD238_005451 [Peronospora effusa]RQM14507.1 hypothetical protein DD237_006355 [Peronospora effusa]CAI5715895.1 unnamed protein product [Peronospora effusa]
MDCEGMTPCATRGKTNTSDPKQSDDDNGDIDASLDKGPNNAGADISSNIKSTNDETTIQTGITNKAATLKPVLSTTLQSAPITHAPLSTSMVAGPSDHRTQGYPSSSSRAPSASKEPDSTEVLENETKSAFSTTASRSLDQTLVVVIIGVVGAIGTLVMFVSRRVLKEQDDDLYLEDSRFF